MLLLLSPIMPLLLCCRRFRHAAFFAARYVCSAAGVDEHVERDRCSDARADMRAIRAKMLPYAYAERLRYLTAALRLRC